MRQRTSSAKTLQMIKMRRAAYEARRKRTKQYITTISSNQRPENQASVHDSRQISNFSRFRFSGGLQAIRRNKTVSCTLPKAFSILSNPDETLSAIGSIASLCTTDVLRLKILHNKTEKHDLAAEALLGSLVISIRNRNLFQGNSFEISGRYPKDVTMQRLLRSMGIVKQLEIDEQSIKKENQEIENINIFEKINNNLQEPDGLGSPDTKTRTCEEFVDYINNCLRDHQSELTCDAEGELTNYLGEVLDNVAEHSGQQGWTLLGYLDNMADSHICEIIAFNFGRTIADTFSRLEPSSYALIKTSKFIKESTCYSDLPKDLGFTLTALQGRISSKNSEADDTRGNGTIELIEFFQKLNQQLGGNAVDMCLLSGRVHITFQGANLLRTQNGGREVVAFNALGKLQSPPDKNSVRHMKSSYFPGTLISIKFVLPSDFYRKQ